jgi:hypothetical protein
MNDPIRDGIQNAVEGDWVLAHYVCVAAFQRVDVDTLESTTILFTAEGQGSYITDGLMFAASRLSEMEDVDEEPDP